MPLLIAVPVLALTGRLGGAEGRVAVSNGPLRVRVEYPRSFRLGQTERIDIEVRNASPAPVAGIRIGIDGDYLRRFGEVRFFPPLKGDPGSIELGDLPAGKDRHLVVEIQAEEYGSHEGGIRIVADGLRAESANLKSFVFP